MEKGDPTLYYIVPNNYTLGVWISSSQEGDTPLWRRVTKKAQEDDG